jgi:hypothetical protein
MKKLFVGAALVCVPLLSQAQGGFQIGIKGGVNLSRLTLGSFVSSGTNSNGSPSVGVDGKTFRDNLSASLDSRTGYSAGLYARFGKNLFLQPELLYTTTEGQLSIVRGGIMEFVTVKSSSFDVPVLLGLKGGPLRFVVGPMASFRIDNNAGLGDALNQYTNGTLNDAWSKAYYSYQIGGGLDLGSLGIDVRHIGNLSDVVQVNSANGSFGQRTKSWQITLAYRLF